MTDTPDDWIEIGKIVAPQGLKGELRVYPSSDFPERFLEPGQRWLRSPQAPTPNPVRLMSGRYVDGKMLYVIRLEGIDTRDQAEALRNHVLVVPESDRLPLDDDEFHVADLVGMTVVEQTSQTVIGTVVDVIPAGHDLLAVERPNQHPAESEGPEPPPHPDRRKSAKVRKKKPSPPLLIPFVKDIVPVVDLETGRIEITPPDGLLE
jgi:16S rRNA processing protein RimM